MRKKIIGCLALVLLVSGCSVKNVPIERLKLTTERKVVYSSIITAERNIDLSCDDEEDKQYVEKTILGLTYLQEYFQEILKENVNCFNVLNYFKTLDLKSFTQKNQKSQFSQFASISGPSLTTDDEIEVEIYKRDLELAKRRFPEDMGWVNHRIVNMSIFSNEELRHVLGSDCFYCEKDGDK